jgi:hypothetical protein
VKMASDDPVRSRSPNRSASCPPPLSARGLPSPPRSWASAMVLGVLVALCAPLCPADELTATLSPASDWQAAPYPLRLARLRVDYRQGAAPLRSVVLRCTDGGPFVARDILLLPGTPQELAIPLPAFAPHQVYRIWLSDRPSAPGSVHSVLDRSAEIDWPVPATTDTGFLAPEAYQVAEADLPEWPARLRMETLTVALLFSLAGAVGLSFRRRGLRVATALLMVICSSPIAMWCLGSQPLLSVESLAPSPHLENSRQHVVVASRRTTVWTSSQLDLAPLYRDKRQMRDDQAFMTPTGSVVARIQPGEPRLFRCVGTPPD